MEVDLKIALGFYVVFLLSTVVHEAAHAWAAMRLGDPTAYNGGQVSLDPMPHIRREPIGMVVMPIFCVMTIHWPMGFASAPYDPYWAARYPRRSYWMALAGPASNALLALITFGLLRLGLETGFFEPTRPASRMVYDVVSGTGSGLSTSLALFGGMMFFMNVLLALFNMLPAPPLDGSSAIGLILPKKAMRKLNSLYSESWAPMAGLIVSWILFREYFWQVYLPIEDLLYKGISPS